MSVMITLLFSFVIIACAVAAMSIGVIGGQAPIKGSCGGLNGQGCELCGRTCKRRAEDERKR